MEKNENASSYASPIRLVPSQRGDDVRNCFHDAFEDRAAFSDVMILAVVDLNDGTQYVRVYSTTMPHLSKLGLLEKAKSALE